MNQNFGEQVSSTLCLRTVRAAIITAIFIFISYVLLFFCWVPIVAITQNMQWYSGTELIVSYDQVANNSWVYLLEENNPIRRAKVGSAEFW